MAKQSSVQADRLMPSQAAQKSAVDHAIYSKAYDQYQQMPLVDIIAHDRAISHVRQGLTKATPAQLGGGGAW